jgi:hypothetical protein
VCTEYELSVSGELAETPYRIPITTEHPTPLLLAEGVVPGPRAARWTCPPLRLHRLHASLWDLLGGVKEPVFEARFTE